MRGIQTPVSEIRHKIFTEIARVAYESENINDSIEAIPFKVCPGDIASYRESIFHERAIASERVRLAMGMSLRPADHVVHVTSGLEESNIAEKYYEPPLMQVIHLPAISVRTKNMKFLICVRAVSHIHVWRSVQRMRFPV